MRTIPKHGRTEAVTSASPDQVWRVLSDPARLGGWSHETSRGEWLGGATEPTAGARFRARNQSGPWKWSRTSEVVTADEPRQLAWRTIPTRSYRDSTMWRIELEPVDGGTRIVQTFDVLEVNAVRAWFLWLIVKAHRDRSGALESDIERLGRVAAGREAPVG
jgi:hypothetical protein